MDWRTEGRVWWVRIDRHARTAWERPFNVLISLATVGIAAAVAALGRGDWKWFVAAALVVLGVGGLIEQTIAEERRRDWDAWYATPESERVGMRMPTRRGWFGRGGR